MVSGVTVARREKYDTNLILGGGSSSSPDHQVQYYVLIVGTQFEYFVCFLLNPVLSVRMTSVAHSPLAQMARAASKQRWQRVGGSNPPGRADANVFILTCSFC